LGLVATFPPLRLAIVPAGERERANFFCALALGAAFSKAILRLLRLSTNPSFRLSARIHDRIALADLTDAASSLFIADDQPLRPAPLVIRRLFANSSPAASAATFLFPAIARPLSRILANRSVLGPFLRLPEGGATVAAGFP
jgi:hypothetical protein